MKKAFGYIRVSTDNQNDSLEVQLQRIKDFCAYNKIELIGIFIDEDVSGYMPIAERPQGKEMVTRLAKGEAAAVVGVKIDRLFRNTVDALITAELWCKQKKYDLFIADQGGVSVDYRTANGKLVFTFLAGCAQYERDKTSERTADVLNHKKSKRQTYSRTPYGFDMKGRGLAPDGRVITPGVLVPNPEEQEVVKQIFEMRFTENRSYNFIAKQLNENEIKPKEGKRWYPGVVKYICDNALHMDLKKKAA